MFSNRHYSISGMDWNAFLRYLALREETQDRTEDHRTWAIGNNRDTVCLLGSIVEYAITPTTMKGYPGFQLSKRHNHICGILTVRRIRVWDQNTLIATRADDDDYQAGISHLKFPQLES